jgi:hypothetical protein
MAVQWMCTWNGDRIARLPPRESVCWLVVSAWIGGGRIVKKLRILVVSSGRESARGARKMWCNSQGGRSDSNDLEVHGGGQVVENIVMMLPFS